MNNIDAVALKCSSCDDVEAELYYCDTCDQSKEFSNENQRELFCDSCLSPHVKKCHEVRTTKGQVPLVCSDHRKLHSSYCKTCDTTFCPNCIRGHRSHEMGILDERAMEIKKVFEMLTRLELSEKPMKTKRNRFPT